MPYTIDWPATAAMIQAIGSIGAIAFAIWIGERQSNRSRDLVRDERDRQAAITAATLSNRLYATRIEADQKAQLVSQLRDGMPTEGNVLLQNLQEPLLECFQLSTADGLAEHRGSALLFEAPVGSQVAIAIETARSFNRTTDTALRTMRHGALPHQQVRAFYDEVIERLNVVASVAGAVDTLLQSTHGFTTSGGVPVLE